MKKGFLALLGGIVLSGMATIAQAIPIIAYEVPVGTAGSQEYTGTLGMDFDVNQDITVFSLGAFDDNSDGLNLQITVRLYERTGTPTILAEKVFAPGTDALLVGGSRFLALDTPLVLTAGFQGSIVAFGYGVGERNGNMGSHPTDPWFTNDGGGALSFVGSGRYSPSIVFPTTTDGGPVNRYAAGTFAYAPVPEPATMLLLGAGLAGLAGMARRKRMKV